jgi:hypothetical protein
MIEAEDTKERRARWMRRIRWGLALAGMACWTALVASFSFLFGLSLMISTSPMPGYMARRGWAIWVGGAALALAPWVIGGIVFGLRWWKSRARPLPQAPK